MKRNIYLMYAIAFLQGMVFYGPVATLYRQAALYFLSKIIFWQASGFVGFLAERVLLTVINYGMAAFLFGAGICAAGAGFLWRFSSRLLLQNGYSHPIENSDPVI